MTLDNSKQLYLVSVTFEALIYAKSEEDAKATPFIDQMIAVETPLINAHVFNPLIDVYPVFWNKDSLAYHQHEDEGDITIKSILEAQQ
jgi:hypothetical protein